MSGTLKRPLLGSFAWIAGENQYGEWFKELDPADRRMIGQDIKDVEFSWPMGMPLMRNLGDGLWEVRTTLLGRRIARIIFTVENDFLILLHEFIKKATATLNQDLDLARKRKGNG
jgi:phage-related protein